MKPLYAIRHKPTGHFLPEPTGYAGRGGSFLDPVDCSGDGPNPRLFKSELSAKRALTAWLQGKHHAVKESDSDEWGRTVVYTVGSSPEYVPSRKKSEMEIVSFRLILEMNL